MSSIQSEKPRILAKAGLLMVPVLPAALPLV
jgi:hypothetical protein